MKKYILGLLILLTFVFGLKVLAYDLEKDAKIYVGGQAIGIKLNNGVEVVGTYAIYNDGKLYKPWEGNLVEKDKILKVNDIEIITCNDLLNILSKTKDKEVKLLIERDNEELVTTIKPVKKDNIYSIGVYIKDSIIGVGTLTYYIKEANIYGSLGHKISEGDFITGDIYDAKVDEIIKPTRGQAGEKKATIFGSTIGNVEINSDTGVQGITNARFNNSNMKLLGYKVKEEVNLGYAQIWTCVNGIEVKKYDIEITKLIKQDKKEVKGIIYKVVDKDLIDISGGIVQGMSGSPIVQDDKIIGAVTHVSISDATIGYGIYIEWMFEDMGIKIK